MRQSTNRVVTALAGALGRRLWLAGLALLWERLWPALWPAVFTAGLFVVVALFDPWGLIPGWLHAALIALFAIGFSVALVDGVRRVRLPGRAEAIRRIEKASGFAHRPLGALADRPAAGVGDIRAATSLWHAHLDRLARSARRLRVGVASPGLARNDPLGLRAVLLLFLVIGIATAGSDGASRIARAFQPDLAGIGATGPADLTLWITPPAYTALAPVFLATGPTAETTIQPAQVTVPNGSAVLARVRGGGGIPRLVIDDRQVEFTAVESASYELQATLNEGRRMAVVQGDAELGAWLLRVIADQPPFIEFTKPPGRTRRSTLRLDYLAEDDYALASVEAVIGRVDDPTQSFSVELPLPRVGANAADETSYHDLTPHPWAGLPVTITLGAVDAIGQTGSSDPVTTVLPERVFNHPIARAVIEQRKTLTLDPSKRSQVSQALSEISRAPQYFFEDLKVYLGLRAARWRLLYDPTDAIIGEVQDLLWDLALTIEDGPLALAERDLREAQEELLEALSQDATDAEIERLIDELLAALDEYLEALAEQAERQDTAQPSLEDELLQAIERDELRDIIEQARELFRSGAREAARELLAQLRNVLENLRAGRFAEIDRQNMDQGEAALRDLERLMQQQQELLDQTFRRSQGMDGDGASGSGQHENGFMRQEALRRRLGEIMLDWGENGQSIPRPLGRAERLMRDAVRALSENLPGLAIDPQTQAIDQLQQGAQEMLNAMLERLGQGSPRPGEAMGMFGGRDPLGRGLLGRGFQDDGLTRVPDASALQRSREILDELYRRAGDFDRPRPERDYIRRLLRRF